MHDDAVRRRLLEVTGEVVSTAGADAVTVRDVAARAGTSASAVYALFGSRDALLRAVADEGYRRFADHLAAAARTGDPATDLLALGLAYRASALADPHFYRVMFASAGGPVAAGSQPGPVTERATFRVLRDAVARVAGGDADEAALALWAQVHGLVSLELSGLMPGGPDERAERYARVLRAVGPALLGSGRA